MSMTDTSIPFTTHHPPTIHSPPPLLAPQKRLQLQPQQVKRNLAGAKKLPAHTLPSLPHQIALEKILVKILKNLLIGIGYEDVKNM